MVATPEKAGTTKTLAKIEQIKIDSMQLREPLLTEMKNDEIFVSHDAYQILKYHGSYQQDNRELRKPKQQKAYSFMLRLKMPCGDVPAHLYRLLDDLCDEFGEHNLRATTRQAFQMHGVMKGDLKEVIQQLRAAGSSTVGACGDVSRNVMCTPAPIVSKPYAYAREYSKVMGELLKPSSTAFSEIWLGEEKVAAVEYWRPEIGEANKELSDAKVAEAAAYDNGRGIIIAGEKDEPLYGKQYLPRKFKMAVTVPGDNSLDIYISDIGLVVITDPDNDDELLGFNVMVGGGMGRTHNKENTFARAADHLGFVHKDDVMEVCKAILAAQRDHGNREVRANARMKYLVHSLGIDAFRGLVESYLGKKVEPWRDMVPWKYSDWMGWHEHGDGKLFLGLNVEQGRVKDEGGVNMKTLLRTLADAPYNLNMMLTPTQSIIIQGIDPSMKQEIEDVVHAHGVKLVEEIDPLTRLSIACPALPMCGLAINEAERVMPTYVERMRALLDKLDLGSEEIMMRMTGCPNGCARPYMAELAFVGDGPKSYQIWVGGSPVLEGRTGFALIDRVKMDSWEDTMEPLLKAFKAERSGPTEFFGDYCHRVGKSALLAKLA
jgi:sulfite reductase (ferredoxin)